MKCGAKDQDSIGFKQETETQAFFVQNLQQDIKELYGGVV